MDTPRGILSFELHCLVQEPSHRYDQKRAREFTQVQDCTFCARDIGRLTVWQSRPTMFRLESWGLVVELLIVIPSSAERK